MPRRARDTSATDVRAPRATRGAGPTRRARRCRGGAHAGVVRAAVARKFVTSLAVPLDATLAADVAKFAAAIRRARTRRGSTRCWAVSTSPGPLPRAIFRDGLPDHQRARPRTRRAPQRSSLHRPRRAHATSPRVGVPDHAEAGVRLGSRARQRRNGRLHGDFRSADPRDGERRARSAP